MSTDSGGPGSKKEKPSDNGTGSGLMEGAASTDEEHKRQTMLAEAISAIEAINLQSLQIGAMVNFVDFATFENEIKTFKNELTEVLNAKPLPVSKLTDLCHCCGTFVQNVKLLAHVMKKQELSNNLKTFLSHYRKLLEYLYSRKDIQIIGETQNLKSDVNKIAKSYCETSEEITCLMTNFQGCLELYQKQLVMPSISKFEVQKCYLGVSQMIISESEGILSQIELIKKSFLDKDMPLFVKEATNLQKQLDKATYLVSQCYLFHIWGISGKKDLKEKINFVKLLNVCCYLKDQEKPDQQIVRKYSVACKVIDSIPILLNEAKKIEASLNQEQNAIVALENFICHIKKHTYMFGIREEKQPKFKEVYSHFLDVICRLIFYFGQHWSSPNIELTLVDDFQKTHEHLLQILKFEQEYMVMTTFEYVLTAEIENRSHMDIKDFSNDHAVLCKSHLQAIPQILENTFSSTSGSTTDCFEQIEKLQEHMINFIQQLLIMHQLIQNDETFLNHINDFKSCLVECIKNRRLFENLAKVTDEMIIIINSHDNQRFHNNNMKLHEKNHISLQRPELRITHFFIDFHIIIILELWKLGPKDDIKLGMQLYFENEVLYLPLEIQPVGYGRDYTIMSYGLAVARHLHKTPLHYKYCLYTTNSQIQPIVEMLHTSSKPTLREANNCYRILDIPNSDVIVYDSCIHPQIPDTSFISGIINGISGLMFWKPDADVILLPIDRSNELEYCIDAHLFSFFEQLQYCNLRSDDDLCQVYDNLIMAFKSFSCAKIKNLISRYPSTFSIYKGNPVAVFEKYLSSVLDNLQSATSTYKILSGLLLSNLFIYLSKSKPDIPFDIAKKLLTTLTVHYNPFATYQCESYMIITTTFSKNYKRVKAFIDNILIVMQSLLKHDENVSSLLLIMHVLPIYYWFNVEPPSCPFQPITSNLEPCVVWLRDLKIFDNVIIAEKQLEALLKGLQPIELEAAPILQLVLIQVCHEYTLLLKYVPVPMILCFICINLNYKKLSHKMVNNISALLTHIGQNIPEDVNYHGDLIDSLFKLLITMNEKFVAVYKYGVLSDKILENSLRIIFKFLTDEDLGRRDVTFLPSLISTWVQCKINSKVFCNEKLLMEYKFWVNLDSIGNKQQYWSNVLSQIISDRFLRVTNFESKVHVFETLLQQDKELNIVTLKLNEILKFEVSKCTKMDISKLAISLAGRNILDHFIQTSFPTDPNAYINVEVLPVILKCVSDNPEDFSEHTLSICSRVNKYFIDLESYIFCGDVTVQWLLFLRQKWNTNVMEILKALTMDHVKFNEIIYQSERKLLMFLLHKELLQNIVSTCAEKLQVTPIPMMKFDDLKSDYTTMTVKSLCFYNDNRDVIFPAFPEADDLCNMLIPFAIMNSPQFQNDIYYYKWKECSQDIDNESTLSDIFHKLWSPVFTHCSDVIDKLESQDMYLNDAIDLFSNTESAQIARTIQSLHTSVMNCRQHHTIKSLVNAGITSIDGIVNHIKTSSESANWIKAISEKVKICSSMGDLTHEAEISIETFSLFKLPKMAKLFHPFSKEGINHFLRRKLSSVSEVEEKILLFLHDSSLQEDIVKKSIKELGESKKLIEFIWNKSNDVNEMDRFVTIALDTFAGEGAEVQDRLIDLTELCSRFSPLLYDLTEDCESIIVLEKFQSTWKFLSTCDNLSNLMKTCLLNIDWYWSIDELQDASEQGTMKQLQDINQFGVYTVKTTEQFHVCSVSLEITEDEENISKRNYSLDDLQELSSKLILITRQTSRWVKDKEYFEMMLREICQISVAVQKLKEYGHMKFLDYEKQFPCISTDSLAKLDEELDNLEFTLTGWIKYTWSCRYKFPHLNFYTTNQLMLLRKEFTHFQNVKDYDISIEVFHLLYSIIGKPVDSTILIKKTLMDKDTEDSEENVDDEVIESESATSHTSIVNETNKDQSDDKVEQGIKTLDPDQRALYDELFSCGYPEYLSLEAITTEQISDVYAAIEWCDEHEDSTVIKNKWLGSEETVDSSFNIDIDVAKEMHSTLSPLTVDNSSSFSCIDSSHIASYFFNLSSKKSNPFERSVSVDNCNLISLKKLGYCLQQMATRRNVTGEERTFTFEKGTPNLIVTSSDNIYFCILQIYSVEKNSTLPTYDEVLLCSSNTSLEQITIFLMRALFNKQRGFIYCLVHAEKLSYLVAEKSMDLLKYLSQGIDDYQMIILCSSDGEEKSNIVSRLHSYRREWTLADNKVLKEYLWTNLTCNVNKQQVLSASLVDKNNSRVRIVTSQQSGVGKSLYIRKLKDKLVKKLKADGSFIDNKLTKALITVPLHGPVVTADEVLSMLLAEESDLKSCIIHLDIPQHVLKSVDDILFSLIILGGLSNSNGIVWRYHPSQLYALEVTMPRENTYLWDFAETRRIIKLLELLPVFECLTPNLMLQSMNNNSEIIELKTPMYQRVYQCLKLYELKKYIELDNFVFVGTVEGTDKDCLDTIIKHMSIKEPTWNEIHHFVWFLNIQLSACEQSNFIRRVKGLLCFTVGFMINMSRDFATSSVSTASKTSILEEHKLQNFWEEKSHSYLFFNKNRTSITHVGLKLEHTFLKDIYTDEIIMKNIPPDMLRFLTDIMKIPTNYQQMVYIEELLERLVDFMNIKIPEGLRIKSPDKSYVLTHDNLTKIMAIQARFRCQIPVILMGETGCGKTHLIRFMCKFAAYNKNVRNMFILKVHGGTTEQDVIKCLEEVEEAALENRKHKVDTVVFFDEANTSDVISLIKEIMCDGHCKGKPVPPYIKFIAACNPYRRHSEEMIEKLKKAGLGWRDEVATEKLGEIPLRDLVYRVLELPDSMKALVYDFGQLNSATETEYIVQMVHSRLKKFETISFDQKTFVAIVLANCQDKMKKMKDECSFVSLRDVERALIIFSYFFNTFTRIFKIQKFSCIDDVTKCLLLTLGVSHLPRMTGKRKKEFVEYIITSIRNSLTTSELSSLLQLYQDTLLDCMEIENNIAKNTALKENVFMMFVCIELCIPLFVVGKPGSSKSLAKTIIENSMKGPNSKNDKMKNFKQIRLHSHQCSNLSTPSSITEAFDNAKNYQDKKKSKSFVSVVVLDEVGLAEASPHLPLKALHPLLEDGTVGSGSDDQRISREDRVAFVGISNWALDPAKMNRGIMVTRSEPTIEDLKESAKGICCNQGGQNDPVLDRLQGYFSKLGHAYLQIFHSQKREFFGLRDFYSLIKMLYWMSAKSESILTRPQIEHAIRRNFSGFDEFDPIEKFNLEELKISSCLGSSPLLENFRHKDVILIQCKENDRYISINDNEEIELVVEETINAQFIIHINNGRVAFRSLLNNNLWLGTDHLANDITLIFAKNAAHFFVKETTNERCHIHLCKQRYPPCNINGNDEFILLSPDDPETNPDCSPLGLISKSLSNKEITYHGESRYLLFLTNNYSSIQVLKHFIVSNCQQESTDDQTLNQSEPYILFGSNFPKDSEFAQVCRNISEIRLCMESGRMVILLNLENLYESLYDVLNQYYVKSGGRRYVDLGLRTNRMKCAVHEQFKLILIAEKDKVYKDFPTPLINRLEKHFVNAKTVLTDWQVKVYDDLDKWLKLFEKEKFTLNDAFIGMSSDTIAAVILQSTNLVENSIDDIEKNEKVLELSKRLLLQMASPDTILRWTDGDEYRRVYFIEQEHSSLAELINRIDTSSWNKTLLQVTTHSHTLTQDELLELRDYIGLDGDGISRIHLESFQTEQDFLNSVDLALEKGNNGPHCVIYECESGHKNGNLISCCRYRLVDKRIPSVPTFFVFLIHLPKKCPNSNFAAFQEKPWLCYHVDALLPSVDSFSLAILASTNTSSISDFFYHDELKSSSTQTSVQSFDFPERIEHYTSLPPAVSKLDAVNLCKRMHLYVSNVLSSLPELNLETDRLQKLIELIPKQPDFPLSEQSPTFYSGTVFLIKNVLKEMEVYSQQPAWIYDEAGNMDTLQEAGTFQNALIRKFDKLVIPIFTKILSFVDNFKNLNVLLFSDSNEISKLWIELYTSKHVTNELLNHVLNEHSAVMQNSFRCRFPFVWIVFDLAFCDQNPKSLLDTLIGSEIFGCFANMSSCALKILSECYIHDKICFIQKKLRSQSNAYYEVLINCISSMVATKVPDIEDDLSLFKAIVAVETVVNENKCCIDLLSELMSQMPNVAEKLNSQINQHLKVLMVEALAEVLNSPYFDVKVPLNNGPVAVSGWMQKLYELHEIISQIVQQIIDIIPQDLLLKWQWICVMKMFFEHVVLLNEENMIMFARRIEKYSEKSEKFQTSSTLKTVALLLNAVVNKKLPRKEQNITIVNCCWSFFIEVLSSICIDDSTAFDEDIFTNIISCVYPDKDQKPMEEKLWKFLQQYPSNMKFLQSIVIKFLLQHEHSLIELLVEDIHHRVAKFSSSHEMQLTDLCNIIISNITLQITEPKSLLSLTDDFLIDVCDCVDYEHASESNRLLAVVKLRVFVDALAINLIRSSNTSLDDDKEREYMFSEAKKYIDSSTLNEDQFASGPKWYLLRCIVRRFGISKLMTLTSNDNNQWILPTQHHMDRTYFDFVAIYNPKYQSIRAAVSSLAATGDVKELENELKTLQGTDMVMFVMAIVERVHSSYLMPEIPSKAITSKVIDKFCDVMMKCKFINQNQEAIKAFEEIIHNKQCRNFPLMKVAKKESIKTTMIRMVVMHSVMTVLLNKKTPNIRFLASLLLSPESLKESLLPAISSLNPATVTSEATESFYACIKGHQYTFDMLESHCPHCGNIVSDHKAKDIRKIKHTDFGYAPAVGDGFCFGNHSSFSYAIIRCIIHSCVLWSTCSGKNIKLILKGNIDDIPLYFWNEIEKDILQLSKAIGHSIDEACLIMHLVLKEIAQQDPIVKSGTSIKLDRLETLDHRKQWEEKFHQAYIEPVMKDFDASIQQALKRLKLKDYNDIFGAVYISPLSSEKFLWHLHPVLSREQFELMHVNCQLADVNPVLYTYLTELCSLQACYYIPDILKLQMMTQDIILKCGYDKEASVQCLTVTEFIKDQEQKSAYEALYESLQKAWDLCHHKLADYDRLHDFKLEYLQQTFDKDTPMKFLIPMTSGPGVITTALIDYLVITHNKFITLCRSYVEKSLKRKWLWKAPLVHLLKAEPAHFLSVEDDFDGLLAYRGVHTSCNGVTKIQFNFEGIEKDIIQKFVLGKPLITHCMEIPQVIWHKPIYDTKAIAAIKRNVKQVPLQPQAKSDILREVKDISAITTLTDVIEVVMKVLQKQAEEPKKKLKAFIETDLMLNKKLRSETVANYCCLEHVVSLWKFLNVEKAKIKVRNKENPFTSTKDEFNQELNEKLRLELEKSISKMSNLDHLLETMYELIMTYVQFCSLDTRYQPLRVVLMDFVSQAKSEPIVNLMDIFPADITLSQVVSSWKEIVLQQDNIRKPVH